MKREVVKGLKGEEIVLLTPETPEDAAELERLEADGKLDASHSLADHRAKKHPRIERAPLTQRRAA